MYIGCVTAPSKSVTPLKTWKAMTLYRVYTQEPYEQAFNVEYHAKYETACKAARMIAVNAFNSCIVEGATEETADEFSSFDSMFTFIDKIKVI